MRHSNKERDNVAESRPGSNTDVPYKMSKNVAIVTGTDMGGGATCITCNILNLCISGLFRLQENVKSYKVAEM